MLWLVTSACPFAFSASSPSAAGLSTLLATCNNIQMKKYSFAKNKIQIRWKKYILVKWGISNAIDKNQMQ